MVPPPVAAPSAADEVAYVDSLLREYLLYRGFTGSLVAFDAERASLPPELDSADAVTDLLFGKHIPSLDVVGLTRTLALLRDRFFSRLDAAFAPAVARLETSIARLFVVHAVLSGRRDAVAELFEREGERLAAAGDDWHHWFGILYAKRPTSDPRFAPFFAPSWTDAVVVSARNFLSETMAAAPRPAILRFAAARRRRDDDAAKIAALERETDRLRAALLARERELADRAREAAAYRGRDARRRERRREGATEPVEGATEPVEGATESVSVDSPRPLAVRRPFAADTVDDARRAEPSDPSDETDRVRSFVSPVASPAECSFVRRESFAWHSGAVTRARYSPDGDAVASGGADGTVRVWSPRAETTGAVRGRPFRTRRSTAGRRFGRWSGFEGEETRFCSSPRVAGPCARGISNTRARCATPRVTRRFRTARTFGVLPVTTSSRARRRRAIRGRAAGRPAFAARSKFGTRRFSRRRRRFLSGRTPLPCTRWRSIITGRCSPPRARTERCVCSTSTRGNRSCRGRRIRGARRRRASRSAPIKTPCSARGRTASSPSGVFIDCDR